MNKIIALLKKDILLQIRNYKEILIAIALSIAVIVLFSFTQSTSITIGVENGLEEQIGFNSDIQGIKVRFMDDDLVINTDFHKKNSLVKMLKNNSYPVIVYQDSDQITLKLNTRDPKAITTYYLLSRHFNGVTEDVFVTQHLASQNNVIIMTIISITLIFGGASRGSSIIYKEKNNGTMSLLYKSGLSSFGIIVSKLIYTLIVMSVILISIEIFGVVTQTVYLFKSIKDLILLIYILITIAILGNFIGIISKTIDECRSFQLILFMPAMLYPSVASSIPDVYQPILRLHPGIAVVHFYEKVLEGFFDLQLFTIILVISVLLLFINVYILKPCVEKAL